MYVYSKTYLEVKENNVGRAGTEERAGKLKNQIKFRYCPVRPWQMFLKTKNGEQVSEDDTPPYIFFARNILF